MAHTPSPWRMMNANLVNKKCHQRVGPALLKTPISIDDARLISAAPDLLAALEDLMSNIDIKRGNWESYQAAVAKARGTTNET